MALLALFSLSGEILTSCFRLFFNALVFFRGFLCSPKQGFLRSTNELNEEGKTPLTKHTVSFFFCCVFFSVVCRKRYSSRRPLFERRRTSSNIEHSFSFFLTRRRIKRARAKHEKKSRACFASSVLSPPLKTSPIKVKSPTTPGDKREDTTTTDDDDDDNNNKRRALAKGAAAFGRRRRRRRRRQRGTKIDPLRANDDALKQIIRRVFEEIKPFVTRHEPDVPEEDLPELSRTRDLSMADFTVQWSRFCAKRKVNQRSTLDLSETIQRQIEEGGNATGSSSPSKVLDRT